MNLQSKNENSTIKNTSGSLPNDVERLKRLKLSTKTKEYGKNEIVIRDNPRLLGMKIIKEISMKPNK